MFYADIALAFLSIYTPWSETIHFWLLFCLFLLQMVSLLMIGVSAWGKWFGLVSSFRVMAAVIAVGLFLFVVAIMGLCGAVKHHQVLLFFVSFRVTHSRNYILINNVYVYMRSISVQHISLSLYCSLGSKITFNDFADFRVWKNFLCYQQLLNFP